jgi:hypothetical protein
VDLNFLPEMISLFPLAWAFVIMWNQRKQLRSLVPLLLAVALLFLSRLGEVVTQLPAGYLSPALLALRVQHEWVLNLFEDLCDTVGILFLVIGFAGAIRTQKEEERRIRDLEVLLPLCSSCKKYRTREGVWKPIEIYLMEVGGARPTHGFCPDCAQKVRDEFQRVRKG